MTMYFLLIGIVLFIPLACAGIQNKEIRDRRVLALSMFAVFLVMALKAPTVGRDIDGYRRLYEMMEFRSWQNYDVSWMEWGYELLTMVFVHIFHAPFQVFMICVYGFLYFSYYCFFRRYSQDYTTSVLLYICFTFLTFDTSAVRTMLGVGICLFAVPFAGKKGLKNTAIFIAIILLAAQIHKSAYIFFVVYFVIKIKFSIRSAALYIGIPAVLLAFRSQFYVLINLYLKTVTEAGSAVGGNMLIYVLCLILTGAIWYYYDRGTSSSSLDFEISRATNTATEVTSDAEGKLISYFDTTGLAMRLIYAGIVMQLFAANSVLARMAQYLQIFILILVPSNLDRLNARSRMIMKMILYLFAIVYFWYFSLAANALDIVPYKFFWTVM